MEFELAQRGRALIDFEVAVRQRANRLQVEAEHELAGKGITADTLPDKMDERHAVIDAALADSGRWRTRALLAEWSSREHGAACEEAFEEVSGAIVPSLERLRHGPTTLEQDPSFVPPAYWSEIWFHRTKGGWDASPFNGFVHGELVHKRYVSKVFPGDIYAMRRRVLELLPRSDYARILELGTSSGHYTVALSERFPDAEIAGVDLSLRMLEQAQRVGNEMGKRWKLYVRAGEDTGFEPDSFDLVTSYAIHHELPPKIIRQWFDEAMRVLEPGGDLLMVDVPRYADLDRMAAWRFDWAAKWGGEPFWRPSAMLDLGALARDAGFADVRTGTLPGGNPYYVSARKAASHG
jgi:SAM-dependent methyltransferase